MDLVIYGLIGKNFMSQTWSDSRVVSGTVASTSESQVGSDINIPQNQTWLINGIFSAHPQGGTFRIAVDSLPGMNGVRIQNSIDGNQLSAGGNGSAEIYPTNFVVQGPAVVQMFTTNATATSGTASAMLNYQVTQS
tara:strand:- start:2036 stop:2443 length:408 start_codon:yes stop_codon:yes gene_type:complete